MQTLMPNTPRIIAARAFIALLSAASAVGCQGQRVNPSADIEPSFAPFLQAETISNVMTEESGSFEPKPAADGTRTRTSEDAMNANAIPSFNPGAPTALPGPNTLRMLPRHNPYAEDLLDHWGHRNVETIPERLGLGSSDDDSITLQALRSTAASASTGPVVAPELYEGDTVEVLGERLGVRYGRWTGGPADTLSIGFNFDYATEAIRNDRAFQALIDRAGKAWSHQIADDWSVWHLPEGTFKARLIRNGGAGDIILVRPGGETSTGLEIFVTEHDEIEGPGTPPSRGGPSLRSPMTKVEPHTGAIEFTSGVTDLRDLSSLSVAVHEIGHVLGSWAGSPTYTDREHGTWNGPNVIAVHGRPAPFQDRLDPHTSVDGERSPEAATFDFVHAGVCVSVMAYCKNRASSLLPHAIDYAFLADLGMNIVAPTDRPETYGFGVWTSHAGASVSVARTLRPVTDRAAVDDPLNFHGTLGTIDLLEARVDAFGDRSTDDARLSYGTDAPLSTVRFAGGLFGIALELEGLPPVIGNANLEVDLDAFMGVARFTSLEVFEHGTGIVFGSGILHYPFELSGNTILGARPGTSLRADFYGPHHEDIAGTLHDPFAGLLASFTTAFDARPARENILLASDYAVGRSRRWSTTNTAFNGFAEHACTSRSSCLTRTAQSSRPWSDWTEMTYEDALNGTTGTNVTEEGHLIADRDRIRIERQVTRSFGSSAGSYTVDGYLASMAHVTFATGFQRGSNWNGEPWPLDSHFFELWSTVRGTAARSLPQTSSARWTGVMLGYDYGRGGADITRHVHGTAVVNYRFSTGTLDVEFENIESRDAKSTVEDIVFEGIDPMSGGTFRHNDRAGYIEGAIFGPGHEEAAGRFQSYECNDSGCRHRVIGTFGGTAVPATPALEARGSVNRNEYQRQDGTAYAIHSYEEWGLWGTKFGEELFGAFLSRDSSTTVPAIRFEGTPSGTRTIHGSAVWTGDTRAFERSPDPDWFTPVKGSARLEADFGAGTVDVDLTSFERGHPDVSWDAVPIIAGGFEQAYVAENFAGNLYGTLGIDGKFYGPEHEGAAGSFETPLLEGVFVTMRDL